MDSTAFTILGEPTRLRILSELRDEELHVGELVAKLDCTQPTISKHLKVLRDAGFVECRVDAQRRVYHLKQQPFKSLDDWLEPYRQLWNRNLDALENFLDQQENNK
ncbi:MAG: metalloregulator ArsR/SmtB family transcription factor [Pseudomonadales bacterium]|nr:metalloregulator ArsR/SmtB family transcription factor [Pseudomonadales bacterium]